MGQAASAEFTAGTPPRIRARASWPWPIRMLLGGGAGRGDGRAGLEPRGGRRALGRGRNSDLHADHDPCGPDRARRPRRQGDLLREAGGSVERPHRNLPRDRREGRHAPDDRVQPPLRSELREPAPASGRWRGRRRRTRDDTVARSRPAAGQLHRHLGRPVPGHDDPRPRHGALPSARRRAGGGACGGIVPGRSGHRPSRRRRHGGRAAQDRLGQDRADLEIRAARPMGTISAPRCTAPRA